MARRTLRGLISRRSDEYAEVGRALDRMAELAAGLGEDKAANRRIRAQLAQLAGPVREHVLAHPDAEERVREDVAARDLGTVFPWTRFNRDRAEDLAVVYCFTPFLDTSALVAARRIRERGVVTDVISQDLGNRSRPDPSSSLIAQEYVATATQLPGEADFNTWRSAREFSAAVAATVAARAGAKPYRSLYSRAMAAQSHFAAAALKIAEPGLRWTAEFSDPMRVNLHGEVRDAEVEDDELFATIARAVARAGFDVADERRMFTWAELVAYALADEVVFTNEHQQRFMLEGCAYPALAERAASVSVVRAQPTLPERFYRLRSTIYPLSDDVVNIGYFGGFFPVRGIDEIVAALERLAPQERAKVHLHVFTENPERRREELVSRALDTTVSVHAYVPYLRFLNLTTRFDLLLVNDYSTRPQHPFNPYLPAKVSDYLGSGTPIWAVQEPGSVLSTLPVAYASGLGDVDGAVRVLRTAIQDLLRPGPRD